VREGAALTGAVLDEHLMPVLGQLESTGRRQRDAVLVGLDLPCDPDPHGGGSLPLRDCVAAPPRGGIVTQSAQLRLPLVRILTIYSQCVVGWGAPADSDPNSQFAGSAAAASSSASVTSTIASRSAA